MGTAWTDPVVLLAGSSLAISGLNAIGSWMLGTHDSGRDRTADLAELHRDVKELKRMFKEANATWSRKHGETIVRMGDLDIKIASIKTELMLNRGYRQEGDPV